MFAEQCPLLLLLVSTVSFLMVSLTYNLSSSLLTFPSFRRVYEYSFETYLDYKDISKDSMVNQTPHIHKQSHLWKGPRKQGNSSLNTRAILGNYITQGSSCLSKLGSS